ncbi:hypothetical protein ADUPG1_013467, partial [Aduncisulcus paluster]
MDENEISKIIESELGQKAMFLEGIEKDEIQYKTIDDFQVSGYPPSISEFRLDEYNKMRNNLLKILFAKYRKLKRKDSQMAQLSQSAVLQSPIHSPLLAKKSTDEAATLSESISTFNISETYTSPQFGMAKPMTPHEKMLRSMKKRQAQEIERKFSAELQRASKEIQFAEQRERERLREEKKLLALKERKREEEKKREKREMKRIESEKRRRIAEEEQRASYLQRLEKQEKTEKERRKRIRANLSKHFREAEEKRERLAKDKEQAERVRYSAFETTKDLMKKREQSRMKMLFEKQSHMKEEAKKTEEKQLRSREYIRKRREEQRKVVVSKLREKMDLA